MHEFLKSELTISIKDLKQVLCKEYCNIKDCYKNFENLEYILFPWGFISNDFKSFSFRDNKNVIIQENYNYYSPRIKLEADTRNLVRKYFANNLPLHDHILIKI